MEVREILLTTDFSDEAWKAYPVAAALAKKFQAKIHLSHFMEAGTTGYLAYGKVGVGGAFGNGFLDQAIYKELQSNILKEPAFEGVDVEPHLVTGPNTLKALQSFEREKKIDLVVLSTHGCTGFEYALLGSFAKKIVRSSLAPVWIHRDSKGKDFTPRKVLVPYDFSDNAAAVLPAAHFLAGRFDSSFTFFLVQEPAVPAFSNLMDTSYADLARNAQELAIGKAREKFSALKSAQLAKLSVDFAASTGSPAIEIAAKAKEMEADLILLATHGWTGIRHFLLGSVAESVLVKAPCSVMTVRSAGSQD